MRPFATVQTTIVGIVAVAGGLVALEARSAASPGAAAVQQQTPGQTQQPQPNPSPGAPGSPSTSTPGQPTTNTPGRKGTSPNSSQAMTLTGCIGGSGTAAAPYMLSNITPASGSSSSTSQTSSSTSTSNRSATGDNSSTRNDSSSTRNDSSSTRSDSTARESSRNGAASTPATSYRLSGTDVSAYKGKRVQIVGAVVPSTSGGTTVQEFRVQSVQPGTGTCP